MQTPPVLPASIKALQKRGKQLRKEGKTWDDIAEEMGIRTQDGRINPGLTYRIVREGYEPARLETRIRIGLPPICPVCKQSIGGNHNHSESKPSVDLVLLERLYKTHIE